MEGVLTRDPARGVWDSNGGNGIPVAVKNALQAPDLQKTSPYARVMANKETGQCYSYNSGLFVHQKFLRGCWEADIKRMIGR